MYVFFRCVYFSVSHDEVTDYCRYSLDLNMSKNYIDSKQKLHHKVSGMAVLRFVTIAKLL